MLMDKSGNIWLSTFDGLIRFDGDKIKVYSNKFYPEIISNRFVSIFEDVEGNIFAFSEINVAYRIELKTDKLSVVGVNGKKADVYSMSGTPDGRILFSTTNGLFKSTQTDSTKNVLSADFDDDVFVAFEDKWGFFWYEDSNQQLVRFKNGKAEVLSELLPNSLRFFDFELSDSRGWLTWRNSLIEFGKDGYKIIEFPQLEIENTIVSVSHFPDEDLLIIGSNNEGMKQYDLNTGQFSSLKVSGSPLLPKNHNKAQNYQNLIPTSDGVFDLDNLDPIFTSKTYPITGVQVDEFDKIWVSTNGNGLFSLSKSHFNTYTTDLNSNIYPILEDHNNTFWVGTFGGGAFSLSKDKFQKLNLHNSIEDKFIISSFALSDGSILFGAHSSYVYQVSQSGKIDKHRLPSKDNQYISTIFEDSKGNIWIGSSRGLFLKNHNEPSFKNASLIGLEGNPRVRYIAETPDSSIWLSTKGAEIVRIHGENTHYIHLDTTGGSVITRAIVYDPFMSASPKDYYLWVTSDSKGMYLLHVQDNEISTTVITQNDGLIANTIHTIIFDEKFNFWMSSNTGLSFISRDMMNDFLEGNLKSLSPINFTERDGLPNNEFNGGVQSTGFASSNGYLYFSNQKGLVEVDPKRVISEPENSSVVIQDVYINDEPISIPADSVVHLAAGSYDVKIYFSIHSRYSSTRKHIYYSTDIENPVWRTTETGRPLVLASVNPGKHHFLFQDHGVNSPQNANIASIVIDINNYWYNTKLAWALYLTLAVVVGYLINAFRIKAINERNSRLGELVETRAKQLQKELEASLIESKKLVSDLSSRNQIIKRIHEVLRQPSILLHDSLTVWKKNQGVNLPSTSTSSLNELILQSKTISEKIERSIATVSSLEGELILNPEEINLNNLVHNVADDLKNKSIAYQARTSYSFADSNNYVYMDGFITQVALTDMVAILLSESAESSAKLSVMANQKTAGIRISIKKANQSHVKAIAQLLSEDEQMDTSFEWLLDLTAIVRRLQKNGCKITSSKRDEKYYVIKLELPLLKSRPIKEFETENVVESESSVDKFQIALFDSKTDYSTIIADNLLPDCNISVMSRNRIKQYAKVIDNSDLVLLDSGFTYANPIQLIEEARSRDKASNTTIVMTTNSFFSEAQNEALRAGADMYITKAMSNEAIVAQIRSFINVRKRLNSTFESHTKKLAGAYSDISRADREFAKSSLELIKSNLSDPEFNVETLSSLMKVSRTSLSRRIKKITENSPSDIIKEVRILKAMELLQTRNNNISEVAYACGYNSLSYFSQAFKNHTGKSPSDWVEVKLMSET